MARNLLPMSHLTRNKPQIMLTTPLRPTQPAPDHPPLGNTTILGLPLCVPDTPTFLLLFWDTVLALPMPVLCTTTLLDFLIVYYLLSSMSLLKRPLFQGAPLITFPKIKLTCPHSTGYPFNLLYFYRAYRSLTSHYSYAVIHCLDYCLFLGGGTSLLTSVSWCLDWIPGKKHVLNRLLWNEWIWNQPRMLIHF